MRKYVLDTNLYIEASRGDDAAAALKAFYARFLPYVHLHSVVAQELLAGALTPALRRDTEMAFIEPFEAAGRVITPTHRTWKRAGAILARLAGERRLPTQSIPRSFMNDCILAASAREQGFILITRNTRDFELISSAEQIDLIPPWPSPPGS